MADASAARCTPADLGQGNRTGLGAGRVLACHLDEPTSDSTAASRLVSVTRRVGSDGARQAGVTRSASARLCSP
jgi:hypothetical protein